MLPGFAESASAKCVLQQAERHADAGRTKSPVPTRVGIHADSCEPGPEALVLCEKTREEGSHKRAQIDAHVENGKTRVTAVVVLRIQLADDDTDVRLQKARAEYDERQANVESRAVWDCQGI